MKTEVEIRTIKPTEAAMMLENLFEGQRKVRESHVLRLTEDMRLGRFRLSPDALLICKGKTANGQHRLAAVVRSGLAQKFLVMETDDTDLYEILDCGIGRTNGDVLRGVLSIDNVNQVAAIARLVCLYDKKLLGPIGGSAAKLGRLDIVRFAETHAVEIADVIAFIRPLNTKSRLVSVTMMGAAMLIGQRRDPDKTASFVRAVFTGDDPSSAAWAFRERMIRDVSGKSKLPGPYRFGLALKALKNYINGNQISVLKIVQGEAFPEV